MEHPLFKLASNGHIDGIRKYLDEDLSSIVDRDGNSPLHLAVVFGSTECIQLLIQSGLELNLQNKHGQTPLMIACKCLNLKSIDPLLQYDADLHIKDHNGETAFHALCRALLFNSTEDNMTRFNFLINHCMKLGLQNIKSNDGTTPFMIVQFDPHNKLIDILKPSITKSARL